MIAEDIIEAPRIKRRLPDVDIATCCEYEKYLVACVNGQWREFFIHRLDERTWQVKSRPTTKCRLCEKNVNALPTRPYIWGEQQHFDDAFMAVT